MKCAPNSDLWNEKFRICITPDVVEPNAVPVGVLTIEMASYVAGNKSMDVTDIIRARVQRRLELHLDAALKPNGFSGLFGSTVFDGEKLLQIQYRYGSGALMKIVAREDVSGALRCDHATTDCA